MYLIETMRASGGDIPLWAWHRDRVARSAAALNWPLLQAKKPVQVDAGRDEMVRLLLHETGDVSVERHPLPPQPATYRIGISPVVVQPDDPWLYHKSSHRAVYQQAREWAAAHGFHDALLRNAAGFITESTIANLIAEIDGIWYTPPVADGLLPGVMRAVLLSEGRVRERSLRAEDLTTARALYLCNAVRGVFPIVLSED